jgi:hypothetical protein
MCRRTIRYAAVRALELTMFAGKVAFLALVRLAGVAGGRGEHRIQVRTGR